MSPRRTREIRSVSSTARKIKLWLLVLRRTKREKSRRGRFQFNVRKPRYSWAKLNPMEDRTIHPSMKAVRAAYVLAAVVFVAAVWAYYKYAQSADGSDAPRWLP